MVEETNKFVNRHFASIFLTDSLILRRTMVKKIFPDQDNLWNLHLYKKQYL